MFFKSIFRVANNRMRFKKFLLIVICIHILLITLMWLLFSTSFQNASTQTKITYSAHSSEARLWFLSNGSARPDLKLSSSLALWPDEGDVDDDRIVNQLMFVPNDYNPQISRVKTIFLYTRDWDWNYEFGPKMFADCPVKSCSLVGGQYSPQADLIIFKSLFEFPVFPRPAHQIWLLFLLESPKHVLDYQNLDQLVGVINWTATYRHDSDIPTPYGKYFSYPVRDRRVTEHINYATNKTKAVVWFVSNCKAVNNRLAYARELAKHIRVDIYGDCGPYKCWRNRSEDCLEMMERDYKFYLSFENSNCEDYITEKFWFTALGHNIVPIVMGARPQTYRRFAPPNSFIHVDDFRSAKHLADYLHRLDSNDEEYNRYLEWKRDGEIGEVRMWCRVCAMLFAPPKTKVYANFSEWWAGNDEKDMCFANSVSN